MGRKINKFIIVLKIGVFYLCGRIHLLFKTRRSRSSWPKYDNAYLWYGEEAYEFNHSGSDDEYMDVLGTIMILHFFPHYDYHDRIRRSISITRPHFKKAFMLWWLRQHARGRPNLPLSDTYRLFLKVHLDLKTKQSLTLNNLKP